MKTCCSVSITCVVVGYYFGPLVHDVGYHLHHYFDDGQVTRIRSVHLCLHFCLVLYLSKAIMLGFTNLLEYKHL